MSIPRKLALVGGVAVLLAALAAGYVFHRRAVAAAEERSRAEEALRMERLRKYVVSPDYQRERQLALRRMKEREAKARKAREDSRYRRLPEN